MEMKLIDREMTEAVVYRYLDYSNVSMCQAWAGNWWDKQWVAATNGHEFILVPMHDGNRIEQTNGKVPPPNLGRVLPETFDLDIQITLETLCGVMAKIPVVRREDITECEACEGKGSFDHFGEDYECQSCDGKGKINRYGRMVTGADPDTRIKINGGTINPRFIRNLAIVVDYTGEKHVTLRLQHENSLFIFELPNGILVGIAATVGDVANVVEIELNKQ